jgi:DNA-binding NtrC family response regulator
VRGAIINAADLGFIAEAHTVGYTVDWPDEDLPTALARLEEMLIRRALTRSSGNRAEAARILNIHRQLLYSKIKRYGLEVSDDRTEDVRQEDAERR